jgi:hypothetical protein
MGAGRSPREVFAHHLHALRAEDLDEIVADYADDAVIITPARVLRGKDGARENFTGLFGDLPQAAWEIQNTVFEGDAMLLEWGAQAGASRVDDGVGTFVFRDGMIRLETLRYTLRAQPVRWERVKQILDGAIAGWKAQNGREPKLVSRHGPSFGWETKQQLADASARGFRLIEPTKVANGQGAQTNLVIALRDVDGVKGNGQMPNGGPFLQGSEIDEIVRWIDAGMPD